MNFLAQAKKSHRDFSIVAGEWNSPVSCSQISRVRGIQENYDATKHPLIYRQRVTLAGR